MLKIGVLALQGDVIEHTNSLQKVSGNFKQKILIIPVKTPNDMENLTGLIIPGGESTALHKLCKANGIFEKIQNIPYIFGTCAGAIMLANNVLDAASGQKSLELMDITVKRNAYGRQNDSFEAEIESNLGNFNGVFIRAPKIEKIGKNVLALATYNKEIIACEQYSGKNYYLALTFHPELSTDLFHKYFIKKISSIL